MIYSCLDKFFEISYLPKLDNNLADDYHFDNAKVLFHSGFELKNIEMFLEARVHCNFLKSSIHWHQDDIKYYFC